MDASEKALDDVIAALGRLLSERLSMERRAVALSICKLLGDRAVKVRFEIELAPLRLGCCLLCPTETGEKRVDLFGVDGGYDEFRFAPRGTKGVN